MTDRTLSALLTIAAVPTMTSDEVAHAFAGRYINVYLTVHVDLFFAMLDLTTRGTSRRGAA